MHLLAAFMHVFFGSMFVGSFFVGYGVIYLKSHISQVYMLPINHPLYPLRDYEARLAWKDGKTLALDSKRAIVRITDPKA